MLFLGVLNTLRTGKQDFFNEARRKHASLIPGKCYTKEACADVGGIDRRHRAKRKGAREHLLDTKANHGHACAGAPGGYGRAISQPRIGREQSHGVQVLPKKIVPWGRVSSGDVVVLKKSGGSFVAVFEATDATYVELSPDSMAQIRQAYGQALCVDDAFWQAKAECSFATLISIGHLFVFPPSSIAFRNRRSWVDLGSFTGQSTSAGGHLEAHCST